MPSFRRPTLIKELLFFSRSLAEQVIFDYILPLPSIATSSATKEKEVDEVSWTDRLLITMRHLSERSIVALIGLSGLKSLYVYALYFTTDIDLFIFRRPNVYDVYVESCMQNNVGRRVIFDKMRTSLLFRVESLTTTRKRL